MEEECSESGKTSQENSEIRELNKTSWETGRESSLYRWSSFTETSIQFAESDSSGNAATNDSRSAQGEERKGRNQASSTSTTTTSSSDGEIWTESRGEELYERYSEEEFEVSEESSESEESGGELKEEFIHKKLQILNNKKVASTQDEENAPQFPLDYYSGTDPEGVQGAELEVHKQYYQNKIHVLHKKDTHRKGKQEKGVKLSTKIKNKPHLLENARTVEQLKVDNILFRMKEENAVPIHQPKRCSKCRKVQGKLTEESFIRKKTECLRKQVIEENIEKHLYEKNCTTLIAEIIKTGPKPNDPPQEIWDRLLRKGEYSCL